PGPRRELRESPGQRPLLLAGGAIMGAALLLQLFAFRILPVATVDAAKRTAANGVSAVLGRVLFEERDAWRRGAAGLVMSAGVALMLLG
ncbi:MAG: EamA family transporter, partial [Myxococcota bacterium]|nr:EamA family transporter [Myxococcota bacterium]